MPSIDDAEECRRRATPMAMTSTACLQRVEGGRSKHCMLTTSGGWAEQVLHAYNKRRVSGASTACLQQAEGGRSKHCMLPMSEAWGNRFFTAEEKTV